VVDERAPVEVAIPFPIAAIAAGAEHNVVVTTVGGVWAWGSNSDGQVGNGTAEDALSPVEIAEPGYDWKVGTPRFTPPAGVYDTSQTVSVSSATPGAVVHYTNEGQEPNAGDPAVPSGGTVEVEESLTLKARGVKPGMPASNTGAAQYTLKVAPPLPNPPGGLFKGPVTVSLANNTPGSNLRYTTDGSDPTDASAAYVGALPLTTSTTLKTRAFRKGWEASEVRKDVYVIRIGSLRPPTLSPPGGTYRGSVDISMTADPGATIHYTTDGSEPSETSPVLAGSLRLTADSRVRARAFRVDYEPSAVAEGAFAVRRSGPRKGPGDIRPTFALATASALGAAAGRDESLARRHEQRKRLGLGGQCFRPTRRQHDDCPQTAWAGVDPHRHQGRGGRHCLQHGPRVRR
jgi:Chitobiase/beta-hexosaminidase C-terminal domain/Regulator of chromosome condensation (RCC1) repeat